MPIKPENKGRYPSNWKEIRESILARSSNRCETCKAPNLKIICRSDEGTYMLDEGEVHDAETGEFLGYARGSEYLGNRFVKVVLTIAHLDHTPENCDPSNLRALCQRCHLRYDAEHHRANASVTRRAKKMNLELFEG